MKPEQQRIAITEACGWRPSKISKRACFDPEGLSTYWDNAPDYLNDLNAMHEAEKVLTPTQRVRYVLELVNALNSLGDITLARSIFATAAQRAEAFLLALKLWKP